MFLATVIVIIGVIMLLNALGIFSVHIWGIFWAILLIVVGLKMMEKKKNFCPMCKEYWSGGKVHEHFHEHWVEKNKEKEKEKADGQPIN